MKSINEKDFFEKYFTEYLKSRLDYNPETGIYTWKYRNGNTKEDKTFNARFAGKEAGSKNRKGYLMIKIDGNKHHAHKIAYLFMTGKLPENQIDHINGNRSDNRWENLRAATNEENQKNRKIGKSNTSGVMRVNWNKRQNKWCVRINVNKKRINLGVFENFNEAVKVRKEAEVKYGYHENHGRPNN